MTEVEGVAMRLILRALILLCVAGIGVGLPAWAQTPQRPAGQGQKPAAPTTKPPATTAKPPATTAKPPATTAKPPAAATAKPSEPPPPPKPVAQDLRMKTAYTTAGQKTESVTYKK